MLTPQQNNYVSLSRPDKNLEDYANRSLTQVEFLVYNYKPNSKLERSQAKNHDLKSPYQ